MVAIVHVNSGTSPELYFFFFLMYLMCHFKTAAHTAHIVNIISAGAHNL